MSDYIEKYDNVLMNLTIFQENFVVEAQIIQHAKCVLLLDQELKDFQTDSTYVQVYKSDSNSYDLYYLDHVMKIVCLDNMIVDYRVE